MTATATKKKARQKGEAAPAVEEAQAEVVGGAAALAVEAGIVEKKDSLAAFLTVGQDLADEIRECMQGIEIARSERAELRRVFEQQFNHKLGGEEDDEAPTAAAPRRGRPPMSSKAERNGHAPRRGRPAAGEKTNRDLILDFVKAQRGKRANKKDIDAMLKENGRGPSAPTLVDMVKKEELVRVEGERGVYELPK